MKHLAIALLAAALTGPAFAQMKGMDMKDMPMKDKGMDMKMEKGAKGSVHKATGTVTKVDKDKVTIKHGPVQSMSWPAMTMTFKAKDKTMLDKLAKDKKVDFEFMEEGKDYVITSVK